MRTFLFIWIMMNLFFLLVSYLIGSLPFSFIIPKLFFNIDIRTIGSGNVGATNVFRACGKFYGFLAFLLDSSKAALVYYITYKFFDPNLAPFFGVAAVVGHCYPVFLNFKGGKGVSSAAGLLFMINPYICLSLVPIFIIIVAVTSYVSLASMIVVAIVPIVNMVVVFLNKTYYGNNVHISLLFLALFVIYRHKSNIIRLKNGTENKVRLSKK